MMGFIHLEVACFIEDLDTTNLLAVFHSYDANLSLKQRYDVLLYRIISPYVEKRLSDVFNILFYKAPH